MGRPTECPKDCRVTARVEPNTKKILVEYCNQNGITEAEGVRHAILKLQEDKN